MKNKEWKVGISMLMIISITTYCYWEINPEPVACSDLTELNDIDLSILVSKFDNSSFGVSFSHPISCLGDSAPTSYIIQGLDPKGDLENGVIRIYIPGGFVSQENPNQQLMKDLYDIDFMEEGCVRWYPEQYLADYNKIVFNYLDKKHGKGWRELLTVSTF